MFGYITPDDPHLYKKDDVLYKSLYCGICKSIGGTCGQMARLSLTYDIAFLSAFSHNLKGQDVEIKKSRCIAHPIRKRPIAKRDDLSDELAYVNLILCKYKLCDDKIDSGKGGFKSALVSKGYKKAKKNLPEIDAIVKEGYEKLRTLETNDNGLIDAVSEVFGNMLADISDQVFKEFKNENTHKLFFYIGKWIYIIDAVDDYDKDKKRGEYNPFIVRYNADSAKALITEQSGDFDFMFAEIFGGIRECYGALKFKFNKDLIENILLRGIPMKTQTVIKQKLAGKKAPKA